MQILLIIPPFTQANTVYPSILQLSGYLKSKKYEVLNCDLSLETTLEIFSKKGLGSIFDEIGGTAGEESIQRIVLLKELYINSIDNVISFLQGKDDNLANILLRDGYLPQGDAFMREIDEQKFFGEFNQIAKARYYCSLFLEDLIYLITNTISPHFGFSRYAEKLAISPPSFDSLELELKRPQNLIEEIMLKCLESKLKDFNPNAVALSVPFPGNLLSALICGKYIKENFPNIKIILGGGYVNTEFRNIQESRIFKYTDFITLDDGELPIENILENIQNSNRNKWVRTFRLIKNGVEFLSNLEVEELKHNSLPTPCYDGINPNSYISMTETLNPMHHLWVAGFWNKLTLAHGCYWHKCTFCDTSLDYINRYSPASVKTVVDWIEASIAQTGKNSFHFTDEAAPPKLLKEVAIELLRRNLNIVWWGNIRFEKSFTADLCHLLAKSGCIAVSGGLETAGDRLLKLIEKGVTLEQTANVCSNFQKAGIMIHSYLMYGFPSQTEQEIIDSLEFVRQLFELGLIQSAFWHRFALTCHSPIANNAAKFGVQITSSPHNMFCNNELNFIDKSATDFSKFSKGLQKATYNYIHNIGIDWQTREWFEFKTPKTKFSKNMVTSLLQNENCINQGSRLFWFGSKPIVEPIDLINSKFVVHSANIIADWVIEKTTAKWFYDSIVILLENQFNDVITINKLIDGSSLDIKLVDAFINSEVFIEIRQAGLLLVI